MSDTVLLVMDVQRGTVSRVSDPGYLPRVARAIGAARTAGVPVVYIVVGFRHGRPEIHPRNKIFGALPPGALTPDDPAAEIHPDVAPLPGEVVVVKNRVSAFAGNDLRQILAAGGVDHLVLAGIATSGVVLATACHAADRDYRLTFLADACADADADADADVHRVLVERVFPRRGEVTTVADWAVSLEGS